MAPDRPNVVLLIADSVRADALSCYDDRNETPSFDALARRGTTFENCYASGPGTPISHASMFSGQHPSETGVVLSRIPIPKKTPLLAEWLRDSGYDTLGFAGPPLMDKEYGFGRGFDRYFQPYDDFFPKSPRYFETAFSDSLLTKPMLDTFWSYLTAGYDKHTKLKLDVTSRYLDRNDGPTFVMANLFTPHLPYDPPRPYKTETTPDLDRPRLELLSRLGFDEAFEDTDVRMERLDEHNTADNISRYTADPSFYTDAELDVLRAWYDAGVRYVGDQIRAFVDRLEARGQLDDTIFVITSDHGDFIGEHELFGHAQYLHEEVTRVPLIVFGQGVPEGERRTDLVSHVDIFDTICDLVGIEAPPTTSGLSLFGDTNHDAVFSEHGLYLEARRDKFGSVKHLSEEQAIEYTAGRKTVRTADHRLEIVSDGSRHLYERPSDESVADPDLTSELEAALVETLGDQFHSREGRAKSASDDVKSQLRELGYFE